MNRLRARTVAGSTNSAMFSLYLTVMSPATSGNAGRHARVSGSHLREQRSTQPPGPPRQPRGACGITINKAFKAAPVHRPVRLGLPVEIVQRAVRVAAGARRRADADEDASDDECEDAPGPCGDEARPLRSAHARQTACAL